jgi:hypothetical protein
MRVFVGLGSAVCLFSAVFALPAPAVAPAFAGTTAWSVHAVAEPSVFSAKDALKCEAEEKCDRYQMLVQNAGDQSSNGAVTLTDVLPAGIVTLQTPKSGAGVREEQWDCTAGAGNAKVVCELNEPIEKGHYAPYLDIIVSAPMTETPRVLKNAVSVESEDAKASSTLETPANGPASSFGVNEFALEAGTSAGTPALAAGAHPWALTTSFGVPVVAAPPGSSSLFEPVKNIKRVIVELPLGFLADPSAVTKPENECTEVELHVDACPAESRVGTFAFTSGFFTDGEFAFTEDASECCSAVYEMKPDTGYPVQFGFTFAHNPVDMYASAVHTPAGYRLRIVIPGVPEEGALLKSEFTLYGEPGKLNGSGSETAFLSNPTDCSAGPLTSRIELTSWAEPEHPVSAESTAYPQLTGCNLLQSQFDPSLEADPSTDKQSQDEKTAEVGTTQAGEPSGYDVALKVPQHEAFAESATPELKDVTVALPQGVSINPAAAQGLIGCQAEGPAGINIGSNDIGPAGQDLGDPEATELGAGYEGGNGSRYDDGVWHTAPGHCPQASTIGTAEIATPVLATPLQGHIYLAQPKCGGAGQSACRESSNPGEDSAENGELFGLYLEVEGSGVIVKLPGTLSANSQTGQLTASFSEVPQLPFSELKLHFYGGPRAVLANPQACGSFTTTSVLEPWSHEEADGSEGTPDVTPSSSFAIGGCGADGVPFNPSFTAGTTPSMAGGSGRLTLTLSRNDSEQDLAGLAFTTPPGLLADLASVPLCGEPQAQTGECPAASRIGTATILAGAGEDPLALGGQVYLTGPTLPEGSNHPGAPYGLSIVVPANVGPFHLGTVVVRAQISIDPATAALTIATNPGWAGGGGGSGGNLNYGLPTIIDGIPLRIRTLNVEVDRAGFILDPTNCAALSSAGTIASTQGASATVSSSYQATGCNHLSFTPKLTALTRANGELAGHGASLHVVIAAGSSTSTPGSASPSPSSSTSSSTVTTQANIGSLKLDLPQRLPARLQTIQKACPEATFNTNPAKCPKVSVVGSATVQTPILSTTMTGPAYLVSKNGSGTSHPGESKIEKEEAAFPDLVLVLQGDGVRINLTGALFVSAKNITSVAFRSIPDVPIRRLGLSLPEGKTSILAASAGLCTKKPLTITTAITAQNGARLKPTVKVGVMGCPPTRKKPKKPKRHKQRRHKKIGAPRSL